MQSIAHPTAVARSSSGSKAICGRWRTSATGPTPPRTYSTPLRLPYPVEIREGDRGRQRVTIEARGVEAAMPATGDRAWPSINRAAEPSRLIGFGVASHGALSARRTPLCYERSSRRICISPSTSRNQAGGNHWRGRRRRHECSKPPWRSKRSPAPAALDCRISPVPCRSRRSTLAQSLLEEVVTDETVLTAARQALAQAGVETLVGGGTGFFTAQPCHVAPRRHGRGQLHPQSPGTRFDNASSRRHWRLSPRPCAAPAPSSETARSSSGQSPCDCGSTRTRLDRNQNRLPVSCHHRSIIASHHSSPPAGSREASMRLATPEWMG